MVVDAGDSPVSLLEGGGAVVGIIVRVHELLGPTNSQKTDKGTIRGDFGTDSMMNICHASDSPESADAELHRFFKEGELFTCCMD